MNDFADPTGDKVSLAIRASAARCYDLVSDVTKMGRLSPECTGGRWIRGANGPAVGATFIGTNKRGLVRWFTLNEVVAATPGEHFAFETRSTKIVWSYRFDEADDVTIVTESREIVGERPATARFFARFLLGGGDEHEQELRDGVFTTLQRLKDIAESES